LAASAWSVSAAVGVERSAEQRAYESRGTRPEAWASARAGSASARRRVSGEDAAAASRELKEMRGGRRQAAEEEEALRSAAWRTAAGFRTNRGGGGGIQPAKEKPARAFSNCQSAIL